MKLERINDLRLEVADLDRSIRWYKRILGLRVLPEKSEGERALQSSDGFRLRIVAGAAARARQFRVGVRLDDRPQVRKGRAHVDVSGGFGNPMVERDGYYGFTVADPDGYMLEFYTDADEQE